MPEGSTLLADLLEGAAHGAVQAIEESRVNKVYRDRNLLGVAFAVDRLQLGCDAGYYDDETDSDYPVVWTVLPTGQVSWHVRPEMRDLLEASALPETQPPGGYDGHSRELKNKRVLNHALGVEERLTEGSDLLTESDLDGVEA